MTALAAAGATDMAAAACRGAARALQADTDDRAAVALPARDGWEGPHRRTFDDAATALATRAAVLAAAALALAVALDEASGRWAADAAGSGW